MNDRNAPVRADRGVLHMRARLRAAARQGNERCRGALLVGRDAGGTRCRLGAIQTGSDQAGAAFGGQPPCRPAQSSPVQPSPARPSAPPTRRKGPAAAAQPPMLRAPLVALAPKPPRDIALALVIGGLPSVVGPLAKAPEASLPLPVLLA